MLFALIYEYDNLLDAAEAAPGAYHPDFPCLKTCVKIRSNSRELYLYPSSSLKCDKRYLFVDGKHYVQTREVYYEDPSQILMLYHAREL